MSLVVAEAASAVLRTALAEQKLLLQEAVDRTDLAQMNFYGERVQLLQSVAGEGADGGGGGGGSRAHADAFPMECVAPGLLLRKVCSENESAVIRRQYSGSVVVVVVVFVVGDGVVMLLLLLWSAVLLLVVVVVVVMAKGMAMVPAATMVGAVVLV